MGPRGGGEKKGMLLRKKERRKKKGGLHLAGGKGGEMKKDKRYQTRPKSPRGRRAFEKEGRTAKAANRAVVDGEGFKASGRARGGKTR